MIRLLGAVLLMAAAQDASPAGNWKWSVERNGETIESKLALKLDGDKLTGTFTGRDGKETPIAEASFKDGEVKFQISRDRNGETVVVKYSGKISGDTITGKSEVGDRSRDWKAERVK
ncbi:MAG TPA: hypothetical protein VE981_18260 [Planctomycetota bacterium]|nr:hypothetical protein [Planctomycetota bacterium]